MNCTRLTNKRTILSSPILPILSSPLLSSPLLSCPILSYPILSYPILSYPILSYHIISYHIISYHIISYHIISYHIISYPILSYPILSYPILSTRQQPGSVSCMLVPQFPTIPSEDGYNDDCKHGIHGMRSPKLLACQCVRSSSCQSVPVWQTD